MLLVKSKELKNSNKKTLKKRYITVFYAVFITLFSLPAQAEDAAKELTSTSTFISIFLSLLFVIAIIFALAYLMRRFNVTQAGNGQMRMVASMMAGAKEKVMVIEVGDEQYLLGVTAHNINHLATLNTPLQTNKSQTVNQQNSQQGFQQKLVQAMAQSIAGKSNNNKKGDSDV
ncbi:flagellar biosynthetic protein FliO [Agaribacter flavus]|uniref:Flagellar protein n=1 Tax=Agaribacter flavus TaxID=1902781 RepID=A0ABV7FKW9_9ALTE